jgi:hypothetical protein
MKRFPHVIKPNKKSELPQRIVYFDVESHVPELEREEFISRAIAAKDSKQPYIIEHDPYLAVSCFVDRGRDHWFEHYGDNWQLKFWQQVADFCKVNSKVWVLAHNAKYDVLASGGIKFLVDLGYTVTGFSDGNPFFIRLTRRINKQEYISKLQFKLANTTDIDKRNKLILEIDQIRTGEKLTPVLGTILLLSSTNYYNASLAQLSVGMLAPASKVAVEAGFEAAKAGLSTAQESLNKAYVELNSLVGYWPEDRPQLVTSIPFEGLKVDSIDAEINRAISENTNVWKALQAITIERQDLRMTIQDYDIAQLEIEVAELTAGQAKDELEKQFMLLYHDIMTLEQSILASQQAVASAEQAALTAKLRFEVGMATQGDVITAQFNLETAKSTLAGLLNTHATAVSGFRNFTGRDPLPAVPAEVTNQATSVL